MAAHPPLSAHTVKHLHRVLSQALKQAVRLRLLPRNPADDVDPPRPARLEMKILDQAQTARLLEAAETSPIYMPVLLAVTTGMRRGECLALRWRDADLDAGTLSVVATLEETKTPGERRHTLGFKAPKTDRSRRTIALPALTVEAMKRHRVRQAEDGARRARGGGERDTSFARLVAVRWQFSLWSPRPICDKACEISDMDGWPSGLRHRS